MLVYMVGTYVGYFKRVSLYKVNLEKNADAHWPVALHGKMAERSKAPHSRFPYRGFTLYNLINIYIYIYIYMYRGLARGGGSNPPLVNSFFC
jgi:hypothetical protein